MNQSELMIIGEDMTNQRVRIQILKMVGMKIQLLNGKLHKQLLTIRQNKKLKR